MKKAGTKGYLRLKTTKGDLNVELASDKVPKTCDNFLQLCAKGYYDGSPFHRVVRHFVAQAGILWVTCRNSPMSSGLSSCASLDQPLASSAHSSTWGPWAQS